MKSEIFFLNEVENAIDSLHTCFESIKSENRFKWKWISISLHHSLYSFCIASLTQGNFDNVLSNTFDENNMFAIKGNDKYHMISKKSFVGKGPAYRIVWRQTEYSIDDELPVLNKKRKKSTKLIGFWTALARVQDSYTFMGHLADIKPLQLSDEEIKEIVWLSKIRNDLTHFIPKTFGISVSDIQQSANVYLSAIEFLALKSRAITYLFLKPEFKTEITSLIGKIRLELT